jgi:L-ascorbate metabolism protein UlaG (beta-lactamase superfamily)
VVDDNLKELGGSSITKDGDISLFTGPHAAPERQPKIVIDQPGEYEVSGVSIFGLQVRSHTDEADERSAVMYKLAVGDLRVVVTGHIFPKLSEDELEALGIVDVLLIPVGGHGYTLDGTGAMEVIKQIEPKLVVPTHYAQNGLNYPVPQQALADVLKEISLDPKETVKKLQVKPGELTDSTQLVILEKA